MRHLLKGALAILLSVAFTNSVKAQGKIQNPITWTTTATQLNDSEFVLVMHAAIQKDWHIYAQKLDTSAVQVPTAFTYVASADYKTTGATEEIGKVINVTDTSPREIETYFTDSVTYKQKITVQNKAGFMLKANVYYQTCNLGMCLPPKQVDFTFAIPPVKKKSEGSSGYIWLLIIAMGVGIGSLLTPCVFPMIPLTVSFFLKKNSSRKQAIRDASIYSLSIISIYVTLGVIITLIYGSDGLNAIASNGWVNLIYFTVFVIFGFSFLGAFEITLPSSWSSKTDTASERGGVIGIFLMALTLVIVSFSCTGPFLGFLLGGASASGHYWSLIIGCLGFSLALALPFALFAIFPSWLKSLPKSGGWLNSVKVVFGLFEIAFALKFLSTADLVGLNIKWLHFSTGIQMGIMKREVFLSLWIVIFFIMGLYLLGKIKFHHDSDIKYVSVFRLMIAIFAFAFSVYLMPGLFGAPLRLISGFPPPSFYNEGWSLGGNESKTAVADTSKVHAHPKFGRKIGCPLNLSCFHDYSEALAYSKQVGKPVMIDFTGFSCTNCRRMEENVWPDSRVLPLIQNDYVLVSLYVDDPTELPDSLKYTSKTTGEKVETYGQKWSDMEVVTYQVNSQPYYALVDNNSNLLTPARGYTPDIEEYAKFLQEGKNNFHPSAAVVK
ncbi:MAG TPA: cytochrome c biogenesis protein CcdA [Bacteroidia bacterium]|nr:cytochrome c biogenesis protein CcdA [Bacteroidia bacterium]